MKILLIIVDGLGDSSIPELGNKTPLEAAKTPNLDWLAQNGVCGLVVPFQFPWQKYPTSDATHIALFGYDPKIYYLGRGPYEAAGVNLDLEKGDVALRGNFATLAQNLKVVDRRAGRIKKTQHLVATLQGMSIQGVKFIIKKSFGHRLVIVLRNENLSAKISDSDPKKEGVKIKHVLPLDKTPEARFTADVLNKFLFQAHQVLKKISPRANCILTRGAGQFKKTPSFKEKHGLKACCIAGEGLYKGIGKILGMNIIEVRGVTGFPTTNLKEGFLAVKKALKNYDFIFSHIKAADSLAEDGNFKGKRDFIERIDKNLKPILSLKNILIVVTADHSTCSNLKMHCLEPVPILITGPGIKTNGVKKFSERTCQKGKLGLFNQLDLMPKILSLKPLSSSLKTNSG